MKRINPIKDELIVRRHLAAYWKAVCAALDELVACRPVVWRDMRSKHCFVRRKNNLIDACSRPYGMDWSYVRMVRVLCETTNVLVGEPKELSALAAAARRLDGIIDTTFPSAFPSSAKLRDEWACGKQKVAALFSYERFCAGERLVVEDDGTGARFFHWETDPKWSAWHYVLALRVGVCCYCNAGEVFAIEISRNDPPTTLSEVEQCRRRRSALDHYWGHAQYPFLGISLCNLIPACTRCNTNFKGDKPYDMKTYLHPYADDFDGAVRFFALFRGYAALSCPEDEDVTVVIRPSGEASRELSARAMASSQFFHLEEVYNQTYRWAVANAIRRSLLLPDSYYEDIQRRCPQIDSAVCNRTIFGVDLDPSAINRHPLAKMTRDIFVQLRGNSHS